MNDGLQFEPSAPSSWKQRQGPDGVHLFNRDTGTNVLFDEVEVPQDRWSRAPRHVSIALLNACDLRCAHCYAPKHKAKLPADVVYGWASELCKEGTLGIGFGGGEPTLYPELGLLCRRITSSTRLAVTITTHGQHFTERLADELTGHVQFIRISVDGTGRTYERIRARPYSEVVRALRLASRVAPVGINFVVNAETFPDIREAFDLAEEIGASEFLFLPEQATRSRPGIDEATMDALRALIAESHAPCRLSISDINAADIPVCRPFQRERGLRAYAHITADGILKRSSFDANGVGIGKSGVIPALSSLNRAKEGTP